MRASYEQLAELPDVLARARELSVRTMIFDVEPLVAWWDSGQESLDRGIAAVLSELGELPDVRAVVFATNSVRRPSTIPSLPGVRVTYLASAGKPLRTAPYRALPRPGAVIASSDANRQNSARFIGVSLLDLTDEQREFAIERYIALDVFQRFALDLGKVIQDKAPSPRTALARPNASRLV